LAFSTFKEIMLVLVGALGGYGWGKKKKDFIE
jgi:hypothetical protein